MTQRIRRFGVGQTAKVFGVLYALLGLVFLPIALLLSVVAPDTAGFGMGVAIAIPVVYGLFGFIFTAIACALYNVVAGMVGGIEIDVGDSPA
jgi:hypothetical protein